MANKNNKNLIVIEDVDDACSSRTTIIKESPQLNIESLLYETNRILLRNVPYYINKEYFELYIDFLSGEVEIERFDQSKIDPHAIMISFKNNIGMSVDKILYKFEFNAFFFLIYLRFLFSTQKKLFKTKTKRY
jgi:hypothetical protein